jgi:hypothetical protein
MKLVAAAFGGIVLGVAATFAAISLGNWRDDGSTPDLSPDDARRIAGASLSSTGQVACEEPSFRTNDIWLITCTTSSIATPTCGVPFYAGGVRFDNCSSPPPSERRYLILVNDSTGKVIDYTP